MPILVSKVIKDLKVDFKDIKLFFESNGIKYKNLSPQTKIKFEDRDKFAKSLMPIEEQETEGEIDRSDISVDNRDNGDIEENSNPDENSTNEQIQSAEQKNQSFVVSQDDTETDNTIEFDDANHQRESINIYLSFSREAEILFNKYNNKKFREYISCLMNGKQYECNFFRSDEDSYKIFIPFAQYGGQLELAVKGNVIFNVNEKTSDCSVFTQPLIENYETEHINKLCSFTRKFYSER